MVIDFDGIGEKPARTFEIDKQLVNVEFKEHIVESSKINLSENCVAFMGEFHVWSFDVVLKTKKEERRAMNDLRLKYLKSKWNDFIE